jgi:hypothetical protein
VEIRKGQASQARRARNRDRRFSGSLSVILSTREWAGCSVIVIPLQKADSIYNRFTLADEFSARVSMITFVTGYSAPIDDRCASTSVDAHFSLLSGLSEVETRRFWMRFSILAMTIISCFASLSK